MQLWLIILLVIIVLVIVALARFLYFRMMFRPTYDHTWDPVYPHKDLRLFSRTGNIIKKKPGKDSPSVHFWHFDNFPRGKTILFCHGNYGNITQREYVIRICHILKVNLLVFDYRGYGDSTGIPTINGIKEDGMKMYKYLRGLGIPPEKIIIWGESLGGIVASWLSANVECFRLVLFSTFSTLSETIDYSDLKPWIRIPLSGLLLNLLGDISNKQHVKRAKCPVIVVHSVVDNLIPYHCAIESMMAAKHGCIIPIKGRHDKPEMTKAQMKELFWRMEVKMGGKLVKKAVDVLHQSLRKLEGV